MALPAPQKPLPGKRGRRSPAGNAARKRISNRRASAIQKISSSDLAATSATAELIPNGDRHSLVAWCQLYMTVAGRANADATVRAKRHDLQRLFRTFLLPSAPTGLICGRAPLPLIG